MIPIGCDFRSRATYIELKPNIASASVSFDMPSPVTGRDSQKTVSLFSYIVGPSNFIDIILGTNYLFIKFRFTFCLRDNLFIHESTFSSIMICELILDSRRKYEYVGRYILPTFPYILPCISNRIK